MVSSTFGQHPATKKSETKAMNKREKRFIRENIKYKSDLFHFRFYILEKLRNIVRLDHTDSHISFGNNHQIITGFDI